MHESDKPAKSLHFIGIAGSGMCPLAIVAKFKGYRITGSDLGNGRNLDILEKMGIKVFNNHKEENAFHADGLVVSSAIRDDNPEIKWAIKNKLPIYHRSDLLAELAGPYHFITVAGTHGKTTTSAILCYLLDALNQDPMAVVGGHMQHFNASLCMGNGKYFVAEADESDGSFLKYQPNTAILNNIDKDHLDHYGDFKGIKQAFSQYLSNISHDGTAIISVDDEYSFAAYNSFERKKISYGCTRNCDFRATEIKVDGKLVNFKLHHENTEYNCRLNSIGLHNVVNAVAALASVTSLGLSLERSIKALASFPGVARRISIIYENPNLTIIDDYAHNPGKIAACIDAVRASYINHDVFVIFEPHRFSRLDTMYNEFIHSFTKASQVYVTPIYAAGEEINDRHNPRTIAENIRQASSVDAYPYLNEEQVLQDIAYRNKSKSVILSVGAGDSSKIAFAIKRYAIAKQKDTFSEGTPKQSKAEKTQ